MTNLNSYLRRADVEALLDGRIAALDETIARHQAVINERSTGEMAMRQATMGKTDAIARRGAIAALRDQLGLCQQFTHRTFREYDAAGTEYHALVDAAHDRVPLDPVKDDADPAPAIAA